MHVKPSSMLLAGIVLFCSQTALAQDPRTWTDESFISISGTIVSPTPDSFTLDYGEDTVTVEMDDWDDYGEASPLVEGDKVTIYGRVDNELFQKTTIEAGSVYVEGLNTYFYAGSGDEEDSVVWSNTAEVIAGTVTVRGTVSSTNPKERSFTVDTGETQMEIQTQTMNYNPLDDVGFQQIEKGDRVSVTGYINQHFFVDRVLQADTVVTLVDDSKS